MLSMDDSRLLLAKSRRLLGTSKRLLRDLDDHGISVNNADAASEVPPKDRSDRPQTSSEYARIDENDDSSRRTQRLQVAGAAPWNRPRQPR